MRAGSKRATAPAVAHVKSAKVVYQQVSHHASRINDVLAALVFSLQGPHTTATERTTVLNVLDDLIRRKIDAGLLVEGQQS